MKKMKFLFTALSLISLLFAMEAFDTKQIEQYNSIINKSDVITLTITSPIADNDLFLQTIKKIADELNVTLVQNFAEIDEKYDAIIYVYGNAPDYIKNTLIADGSIDNLKLFEEYSSKSQDKSHKLFNFFTSENYAIKPMVEDGIFSVSGRYRLQKEDGPISQDCAKQFKLLLSEKFPNLKIELNSYSTHGGGNLTAVANERLKNHQSFLVLIDFLFIAIFNAELLKYHKNIMKFKLEGYSNIEIYSIFVLRPSVIGLVLGLFLLLGLSLSILPFGYLQVTYFYKIALSLYFVNIALVFILSTLYLSFITSVPINISFKGKKSINPTLRIIQLLKLFLLCYLTTIIPNGLEETSKWINYFSQNSRIESKIHNLYQLNNSNLRSNFFSDKNSNYQDPIYLHLAKNNNAFQFINELISPNGDIYNNENHVYIVDQNYLRKYDLIKENESISYPIIYTNNDITNSLPIYKSIIKSYGIDEEQINIEYIKDAIESFSSIYFYDDYYVQKPMICIPHHPRKYNQYWRLFFYYDGSLSDAQGYIDDLFLEHGYEKTFEVVAVESDYFNFKNYIFKQNWQDVATTIISYCVYFVLFLQITKLDSFKNQKRYFSESLEGYFISPTFVNSIFSHCGNILFYFIACLIIHKKITIYIIISTLIFLIIETIFACFYNLYLVNTERKESL